MSTAALVVLLILVAGVIFVIGAYNGLIRKRIQCDNAWSQIDVQLKRRHDLIPNLVETVKGYAGHEQETLERVIQARNTAMGVSGQGAAAQGQAENMLTGALKSIFALSEAYPDLKANENFLKLQEELSTTENKISFSRQHYNDSVSLYLSALQSFPSNIIASMFNFESRDFFELDAAEAAAAKEAPKVAF